MQAVSRETISTFIHNKPDLTLGTVEATYAVKSPEGTPEILSEVDEMITARSTATIALRGLRESCQPQPSPSPSPRLLTLGGDRNPGPDPGTAGQNNPGPESPSVPTSAPKNAAKYVSVVAFLVAIALLLRPCLMRATLVGVAAIRLAVLRAGMRCNNLNFRTHVRDVKGCSPRWIGDEI